MDNRKHIISKILIRFRGWIQAAAGIMIVTSLRRPIEALVHIVAKKKY